MRAPQQPDLIRIFAALADPTRQRLLNLMRDSEICVCYFVEVLKQPQPKISRHLAYLRSAGLVQARRDGKWMHYRLERSQPPAVSSILQAVLKALADDIQMQSDLELLATACCEPRRFVTLQYAPAPIST